MKVRIGIGIGRGKIDAGELAVIGRDIVACGFDSIWLSEVLAGAGFDPLVALAYLAGAVPELKLGTTMLLPGRNLARLAKSLGSLDQLCAGKLLVTFVPGLTDGVERAAVGVAPKERGAVIDEYLPLLRRIFAGERVDYETPAGLVDQIAIEPRPRQDPLEFWLGGMVPRSLERCGRLGDGWLPSLCTPKEAYEGRLAIEDAAESAGRAIDPEHFGVSLTYACRPLEEKDVRAVARRARGRNPLDLIPVGRDALRKTIEGFIEVGFSKFVIRPQLQEMPWHDELAMLASDVGDLQN